MSVITEMTEGKEGIGVYYPIYLDGSCAEPQYIRFFWAKSGMSLELGTRREFEEARSKKLLRR